MQEKQEKVKDLTPVRLIIGKQCGYGMPEHLEQVERHSDTNSTDDGFSVLLERLEVSALRH